MSEEKPSGIFCSAIPSAVLVGISIETFPLVRSFLTFLGYWVVF